MLVCAFSWEQRKLSDMVERVTRKNENLESELPLTISAQYGLIDQNEFFDKRIASRDVSGYYLLKKGEFAYNKSTSSDAPWGAVKRLDRYEMGVLSTLYIVFALKEDGNIDSDFLVSYYDTDCWHKGVQAIAAEGARNHGLLNITPADYFETVLTVPSDVKEQHQIGTFFAKLDTLITLHQRECFSFDFGSRSAKVAQKTISWEQRKVGELTVESSEYTTLEAGFPLLTSSRNGLMYQNEYRGKQTTDSTETMFSIVPLGACTYRHMSDDDVFHLNVNRLEKGLVSREYPVFYASDDNNLDFIVQQINSSAEFRSFCAEQKKGGTRTRLYYKNLCEFQMLIPNTEEQEKIATFLLTLDTLITLHQRKCDALQKFKKSMLQKMFPQNGESVPEIRFAGFTDAWEQRKVLDLLVQPVTDGPHETPELVEEGIPFISVDAIVDNKIDFDRKRGYITEAYNRECCKKYKPQLLDVFLVKSGSTVGKVAIVDTTDNFNIWSPLAALRCGEKTSPYFLYFLLQTRDMQAQVSDKASNGTQPNLSMRELEKFGTIVPASIDEQKAIGNYFKSLDHLITLHQRKLETLQKMKKSLLQKMFV